MIINTNMNALTAHRSMSSSLSKSGKAMEKLSSGFKINKGSDDAAGLSISEKMRAQIRGLNQAASNAQNAVSLLQTAEGALTETQSMLHRMRELAIQGATDTNTAEDNAVLDKEFQLLKAEIDRVAATAQYNKKNLIDGSLATANVQVGANANQTISFNIRNMTSSGAVLNLGASDVTTVAKSQTAIAAIDNALSEVSMERATIGAVVNRMEYTVNNLSISSENLTSAESRIRDTDMAKEMMNYSKFSILQQASQAMIAQANLQPQGVLQLLS